MCGLFIIFLVTFAYKSHIKYMKGDVVVSETPSDSAPTPSILVCVKQVNLLSTLECDEAPKHFTGHDNQLPSLSGWNSWFEGFSTIHKRTQEYCHFRENPSNHELLAMRGID